ncbi:MAG TPA: hypothetical protein VFK06_24705 [Candidatus Angelobacter sp.]|nr:hypothetical protein [Candidatus Angelobacter sp.]
MPSPPQHTLGQQFGRFLVSGALVFTLVFWFTSSILVSAVDVHRDSQALRWLIKGLTTRSFADWLADLHHAYLPFFLGQRPLVGCYLIAVPLAWGAAFLYDTKIQRKENKI